MLSKTGLAVLDALSTGREATVRDLAAETGASRKQVYRVVDDMIGAGLVDETRGHHNLRVVRATGDPVVEAYRHLNSNLGHVEWPELLSPATIRVCWFLDDPRRVTTIADRLGITRQAVHKALSPLKNRAMLIRSKTEYALSDDLRPLLEFARAIIVHEHRIRVRALAPSATVGWCDPKRALVRVHDPKDTDALQSAEDWELTGLARFLEYDLLFFLAGEPAFWYAPDDPLTPADIVCHTLVLEADSRRVSYALLLIEQEEIDRDNLTETATWYGIERTVSRMYAFLNGDVDDADNGRIRVPNAREYAKLKAQYEVT
ncbi:helix-turn-helix domain-containing protein [Halopenitus sp. H-Gu1]|uniref:helix-turn-helix domain-containing protein n=1 Tax=Halopenitus sp. H-Gu1 TaxID=3242697 RepID=UPI00359DE179